MKPRADGNVVDGDGCVTEMDGLGGDEFLAVIRVDETKRTRCPLQGMADDEGAHGARELLAVSVGGIPCVECLFQDDAILTVVVHDACTNLEFFADGVNGGVVALVTQVVYSILGFSACAHGGC